MQWTKNSYFHYGRTNFGKSFFNDFILHKSSQVYCVSFSQHNTMHLLAVLCPASTCSVGRKKSLEFSLQSIKGGHLRMPNSCCHFFWHSLVMATFCAHHNMKGRVCHLGIILQHLLLPNQRPLKRTYLNKDSRSIFMVFFFLLLKRPSFECLLKKTYTGWWKVLQPEKTNLISDQHLLSRYKICREVYGYMDL